MLLSAVVHLIALGNGSIPANIAPAIHKEFLEWLPASLEFHDADERRPFTISDLQGMFQYLRGGYRRIARGQQVWFRVTLLKPINVTLPKPGGILTLSNVSFEVLKPPKDGEPLSQTSSYRSLINKYDDPSLPLSEAIEIEFVSPTTFHEGGRIHTPLPLPKAVFDSWLTRWEKFSPSKLPDGVQDLRLAQFGISKYKLETHGVRYGKAEWIGFQGTCTFRVFTKDPGTLKAANILADYSMYCGTGVKLSYGLGQTRRLPDKPS